MNSILSSLLAALCLLQAEPQPETLRRYTFGEVHMGVPVRISLYAPDEPAANKAARAAFDRVRRVDWIMSDYKADSELMQLCRKSGPGKPVKVSPELIAVLRRARQISEASDGAFDVSVGPVVRLWRRARRRKRLPKEDLLQAARRLVDYRRIHIDPQAGTVELKLEGMRLDLGGIAKGYAADQALAALKRNGITRAMIDAGGDIVVSDPPPGEAGWKIGVAPLERPDGPPSRYLLLKNAAVATSGDAFQYVEIDGRRYSHIVDPRTGLGLTTRRSATVIAPDGTTADALASAVSVLGPEKGLPLIEKTKGAAALIVQIRDGRPQEHVSRRFGCFEVGQ